MYTVTPDGYVFNNIVRRLTDEGQLSTMEYETNILKNHRLYGEAGDKRCDYSYSNGCRPAIWRYIDEYSTVEDVMWGYLCANCASYAPGMGVKLLEPLYEAVYDPDIGIVRDACRLRHVVAYSAFEKMMSNTLQ